MNYATLQDLIDLWRPLLPDEKERAEKLLGVVSSSLRYEGRKVGKDLDRMVAADPDLAEVAKSVTVDVVARTLMTSTSAEPMTQFAESAGGLSMSGTYLVPGGGLFIKRDELKRLGLLRQRLEMIELAGGGECSEV